MTKEEAYEKLELPIGTDLHIVRQKFQQMHNEFQVQIDGAFREDMRQKLQTRLMELEEAYKLLIGSEKMDDSGSLPHTEQTFEQKRTEEARAQTAQQQQQQQPPPPPRQEESQQAYKEIKDEYPPKSKQIWRHIGLFLAVSLTIITATTGLFLEKPEDDLVFHILAVVVSLGILSWLAWIAASKLPIKNTWITVTTAIIFTVFGFVNDFMNEHKESNIIALHLKEENGKAGYVNDKDVMVIPAKYDWAFPFKDGYAPVAVDGKWGMIDKSGKEVVPIQYDAIDYFSENMAPVMQNGKMGYVNDKEELVIPLRYDWTSPFKDGYAPVAVDGKWGMIDKSGKEVVPIQYDAIDYFSENMAPVMQDGKVGYVNKTGQIQIALQYDAGEPFSEGLAAIGIDGKFGFINADGETVIPMMYEGVSSFSDGLAWVYENVKFGYIDKKGTLVIPIEYDDAHGFYDGVSIVSKNGVYRIIDKQGKTTRTLGYDIVDEFSNGVAAVFIIADNKWGFIDRQGNEIIPLIYDDVLGFKGELFKVTLDNHTFYINKKGKCIRDCPA